VGFNSMGVRVGSGAERVILCLGFSVKVNSNYIRGRAVGQSAWSGCMSNHRDAVRWSVGPAGPAAREPQGCGPVVGRSGWSGCMGTTGMRSDGRSVRLVRLYGRQLNRGAVRRSVGPAGRESCMVPSRVPVRNCWELESPLWV
jgi:hypothetical protein